MVLTYHHRPFESVTGDRVECVGSAPIGRGLCRYACIGFQEPYPNVTSLCIHVGPLYRFRDAELFEHGGVQFSAAS